MSLLHDIALTFIPKVGDITARVLVTHFGSAEDVFSAKKKDLKGIPGIGDRTAAGILNHHSFERAEQELKFIEKYKIQALSFYHESYPKRLRNCFDAPFLIYFKGKADLNAEKVLSIVGTRNSTSYGKELCTRLLGDIKGHDPLIVSGLAYGIDGVAHKESVKNGIPTIGVLGHGLDRIYPAQHRELAEKMLAEGGLLTEFPSGTNPDRENFPKRNRIIAGMSDATVVVEATVKGGALITAEIANSYNRDVFAFPGNVDLPFSEGCNFLIKTARANLITSIKDLEYLLGWQEAKKVENPQLSLMPDLSADERKIAELLKEKPGLRVDDLAIHCDLPLSKLAVTILEMEMRGLVIALPGKTYKLAINQGLFLGKS
ncbi:MAG TPA: DNA-processing protein DprA [Sphingobacteriaceae bacterium]